ncbi:hypothetical protein J7F01_19295 [Streptomyces sp. ISL-22]|uniref:hypothetical protein n=1 Tax=unclassified Streptomyces TaxID=2593676 RepID=UPI001BE809B9|nr:MULTISPECIES: hypothetical protein [unclassified Streptomyces]MBT2418617.1 hypothetical protein [Streptomyces sp. ISL-24]MBT2434280.1 hypothetical protein [Streptomyces sp. ISL-22]
MPGTVLLLAAAPAGRGCLVDAASVLPVLAAVAPPVLSGTDTANVVELADPLEPQAVLTRLRAAAIAPGPLTVFVTGQLQLDRRQHLPHLALARTTPPTVRYTGFPWHWIREELRLRAPGSTTLLLDLHADTETWEWLRAHPLDSGRNNAVYGRIAPPPNRRTVAAPAYMKAVATLLRSGHRPPLDQLHQQALARISPEGGMGIDIVLTAQSGTQIPPQGPAPALPPPLPGSAVPVEAVPVGAVSVEVSERAQAVPQPPERPLPSPVPEPTLVLLPAPPQGPAQIPAPGPAPSPAPGAPPIPAHSPTQGSAQTPAQSPAQGSAQGSAQSPAQGPAPVDPHAAIAAAVEGGRHGEAEALAAHFEQVALRALGPASEEALHWIEVRADLAMLAGDAVRSCRTWLTVASARLSAGQAPDAPAVEAAVDRAHHQWGQIKDAAPARELGPVLAELRGRVPGRRRGALENVLQQLKQLQTGVTS